MFAEIGSLVLHPKSLHPSALYRDGANVLAMPALGLFFCRPHRLLPPTVRIGSPVFCLASVMFFAAAALRHSVVDGKSLHTVLIATALFYGVLLLVSIANWIAELTLCLCISAGIDLVASCLALPGLNSLNGESARSVLFVWQLAAVFVALVQLRSSRQHAALP